MGRPAKYPPEFQREAVEFVLGSGRSINEVALSLGIKRGTLGNWVKAVRDARDRDADPAGLNESERAELQRLRRENVELRADREILRKAAAYFARDDAVIRFRFVEDHRGVYDVKRMCALVEVPRSSFYDWAAGPTTAAQARQAADAELTVVIEQVWRDSRRTYGWPRVWGQLTRRRGMTVSRRRVARIMREHGFVGAHTRRRWRRGRRDIAPASDHLQRVFTAPRPNLRWVADITEFPTGEGKLHLAGIRDLCHRGIVGWSMDEHQDAQLVVDALTMALGRTAPDPDGLIHHSDKGSQYTALDFVMAAGHAGLQLSFGSTGDCFDNAAMETFWATLKREIAHIRGSSGIWFETRDAARAYLFEFIEVFYNRQRHQAGLGHLTPAEYAARFRQQP